jgi:hypothetical protein
MKLLLKKPIENLESMFQNQNNKERIDLKNRFNKNKKEFRNQEKNEKNKKEFRNQEKNEKNKKEADI